MATVVATESVIPLNPPARRLASDYALDGQQLIPLGMLHDYYIPYLHLGLLFGQVNLAIAQGGLHRWADDSHRGETEHSPSLPGCVLPSPQ